MLDQNINSGPNQVALSFELALGGGEIEIHDLAGGRWLIDRDRAQFAELAPDHPIGVAACGFDWVPYLETYSDDATGDLVILVTPTRIIRLRH